MVRVLKAGTPKERIRRDYAPDFPKDIRDALLQLDESFFILKIRRCAPNRCYVLDKSRLILTHKIVGQSSSYTPASFGPVEMPADISVKISSRQNPGSGPNSAFDSWMEGNGWDEKDLKWAYKRVKLRRNIYGILSLTTPLGLILFPFWFRALYLAKAMKCRDFDVKPNIVVWFICLLYTISTLFVYAAVMFWIIKETNWGMGLRDRRALIPTIGTVILIGFLLYMSR